MSDTDKNNNFNLGHTALKGGMTMGASQILKIGIQFLSVITLARFLNPEDFGLLGSVGPIIAFITLFQDLGLQQAIVQRYSISQTQLNHIFWVTTLASIICLCVIIFSSPLVAHFYNDDRLLNITILSGIPILLYSLSSVPTSLLNRNLMFGKIAVTEIICAVFGLISAAFCGYIGMGYWSLIIGTGTAAVFNLVLTWYFAAWMPNKPDFKIEKDIRNFGANLTGFNIVNFFARNLDNVLIGKFFGPVELGYYDRAYKLLLFPIQNVNGPLTRVLTPLMSKIKHDKVHFRQVYIKFISLLCFALMPGIAAFSIVSETAIEFFFGAKWLPIAPIFAWLGLIGLIQPIANTTGLIFVCQGRTDIMFKWGLYSSITSILAFIIGLQWGAVGVAAAYTLSGYILQMPVLFYICHKLGPVKYFDFLQILFPNFAAAGLTYFLAHEFIVDFVGNNFLIITATTILSYSMTVICNMITPYGRNTLTEIGKQIKSAVSLFYNRGKATL